MPTPILHKYLGRKPDHHDSRDRMSRLSHLGIGAPLPPSADVLSGISLPVFDQGELGSCTANTGALYRMWLSVKFQNALPTLSRLFLYYEERALPWNNDVDSDSGAEIRDIFVVLSQTGICTETYDPYNIAKFTEAPSQQAITDATNYEIKSYNRVVDLQSAKACLAGGYPTALGFPVYESFEAIGSDGVMPMPKRGEQLLGGHAVFCHGYDDGKKALMIQNSWGASWGAQGHFWMPYDYLSKYGPQIDLWMGHL